MDNMEQRRNRIVAFINERSSITFAELKKEFPNVSDMTLRTDLRALDEEKKIIRIHGGAKAVTTVLGNDDQLVLREVRNVTEKEQLVANHRVPRLRLDDDHAGTEPSGPADDDLHLQPDRRYGTQSSRTG